jgi:hypothetical protein
MENSTNQRIDLVRISTELIHSIPHASKVDHWGYSSKVLVKATSAPQTMWTILIKIQTNTISEVKLQTCKSTRAGLKGISTCLGDVFSQSIIFSTSSLVTWKLSQLRIADSKSILIEYGSLSAIHKKANTTLSRN